MRGNPATKEYVMKPDRHPLSYDNRGAEPHRPWPKQHRHAKPARFNPRFVLVVLAVLVALAALYHSQSNCYANSSDVRVCVD